ncbi:MAG: hypothetical protein HYY41_00810, partial [Chloroflexi bacterium]|nr:hypothetical protein [Chloroflexota bacterium]
MRILKRTIVTVVVCLVSLALLSCTAASDKASATENQVVTVQRGNLRADITAVGNLALSHKLDLPFDIPAAFDKTVALTVQEVLV